MEIIAYQAVVARVCTIYEVDYTRLAQAVATLDHVDKADLDADQAAYAERLVMMSLPFALCLSTATLAFSNVTTAASRSDIGYSTGPVVNYQEGQSKMRVAAENRSEEKLRVVRLTCKAYGYRNELLQTAYVSVAGIHKHETLHDLALYDFPPGGNRLNFLLGL